MRGCFSDQPLDTRICKENVYFYWYKIFKDVIDLDVYDLVSKGGVVYILCMFDAKLNLIFALGSIYI